MTSKKTFHISSVRANELFLTVKTAITVHTVVMR